MANVSHDGKIALLEKIKRQNEELLWANVFHDEIIGSEWLKNLSFHPGRMAVGYNFLYVMYRVLSTLKPKSILELGLGESTRMITQYAKYFGVEHIVIEHDAEWINAFCESYPPSSTTEIKQHIIYARSFKEETQECIYAYDGIKKTLENRQFQLIVVDGPYGWSAIPNKSADKYARIDILEMLYDCLKAPFCIMVDDAHRKGETGMINEMRQMLTDKQIQHSFGVYSGEKDVAILTSVEYKFLASM